MIIVKLLAEQRSNIVRCGLAGAVLLLFATQRPVFGASFTPEQRTEIIQIIRDALKNDPTILREAVDALQSEQTERQAAAARETIAANHDALYDPADPVVGNPKATVTIIAFYDPRCPYCRRMEPQMAAWLQNDTGVRVVYKDLPILGPPSVLGSRALLAAQRQDGYQKLRDAMMRGSPDITEATIHADADEVGLDWTKLQKDMADPAIQQRLDANIRLAKALDIDGTPSFVVGDRLVVGSELTDLQGAVAAARAKRE